MAYPTPFAQSGTPSSRVELHISAHNLLDKDVFSKSDPMVVVYTFHNGSKTWNEVGQTLVGRVVVHESRYGKFLHASSCQSVASSRFVQTSLQVGKGRWVVSLM